MFYQTLKDINIKTLTGFIVCCCLVVSSFTLEAEIYKWKDKDGRTHFSDRLPVNENVVQVKLKINSYTDTAIISTPVSFLKESRSEKEVVMYSTAWCPSCRKAKAYYKERGIDFKEYDVETSEKGKEDFQELGGSGVPIILVGEKRLNGFSKSAFDTIYDG